ncbi:MAG: hypothetical protein HUJ26_06440 [Planctomycetaceae bacterium]|nr:hypothetical protein [Planctomycetaceae bacterium]
MTIALPLKGGSKQVDKSDDRHKNQRSIHLKPDISQLLQEIEDGEPKDFANRFDALLVSKLQDMLP